METGQKIQPEQLKIFLQNVLVKLQDSPNIANDHPLVVNVENHINSL